MSNMQRRTMLTPRRHREQCRTKLPPCRPKKQHHVQGASATLLSITQQLIIISVGALIILLLTAGIDIVVRLFPFDSLFHTTLILFCIPIVAAILGTWKVIIERGLRQ
ncbi:hypothetical protein SCLCIDRAFT_23282 [Scleroderma citrinum Foug A]|uniref:Uncharacterized protein n=1 Tax=Scleroderma citrinum Foug A TaxID=1036808 RepID=A0A0C3DVA2_9AGAM|nr:hypothetical protein SCLCIDRAFT_23282 [Scleroderma citrinum Foug A]